MIRLAIIVAAAENGVIGRANTLPWKLSGDMRHFKSVTMGKPVVMGRKTFESIGRPLPERTNIVITRNPRFQAQGVVVVSSLAEALEHAAHTAAIDGAGEAVIIGGAQIYREALPRADILYVTEVHAAVTGDAVMPPIDWSQWREVSRERHAADSLNVYDYSFVRYERAAA